MISRSIMKQKRLHNFEFIIFPSCGLLLTWNYKSIYTIYILSIHTNMNNLGNQHQKSKECHIFSYMSFFPRHSANSIRLILQRFVHGDKYMGVEAFQFTLKSLARILWQLPRPRQSQVAFWVSPSKTNMHRLFVACIGKGSKRNGVNSTYSNPCNKKKKDKHIHVPKLKQTYTNR